MTIKVHIPAHLRGLYGTERVEQVEAENVAELVAVLDKRYRGMGERLLEPDGTLRRWVNIFISGDQIRWQGAADTELEADAEVWIVPNVAGG
jgi:molybdopterin synthase sulfur carrier subunit